MRIDATWLVDPRAQAVLAMLGDAGHEALFVGGCVRNALLEKPVSDVDIATDARPETVMALAEKAGFKPVPTGIDHGTVTVVIDGKPFEITTFRRDVETDGRHAIVAFSDDIAEDAARRDFTMNALYARADGLVVDPLGGLADLKARRVRFVGEAEARIAEDNLRILRYFRFHAWYGDHDAGLDAEALAACAARAEGLETLAAERIGAELLKLLSAPDPAPSVAAMGQSGILARILPGAVSSQLAVLVHLENTIGVVPEAIRRLALIGGAFEHLRLSKKQAKTLLILQSAMSGERGTAELAWRFGRDTAQDIELLRAASYGTPLAADLDERLTRGAEAEFPVRGADFKDRFSGSEIGERLADAEARWIASDFTLDREALLE